MKNLFLLSALILLAAGCKKDNDDPTTSLEIRIIDTEGVSIPDAEVTLYTSLDDLQNQENPASAARTSDVNGEVTFENLDEVQYYWFAEKGCNNNVNTVYTTDALVSAKKKIITSTIIETGDIKITNPSTVSYEVYFNGYLVFVAEPGAIYTYIYIPAGTYEIRAKQVGGTVDESYVRDISCGTTVEVTLPG